MPLIFVPPEAVLAPPLYNCAGVFSVLGGANRVGRDQAGCARRKLVRRQLKMATTVFRFVLRGWRTGVPPGCGLRRLVRKLILELGAEG